MVITITLIFNEILQNQSMLLLKHVYLSFMEAKFQMFIAQ